MIRAIAIYYILFGILTLAGGVLAYTKAKSLLSFIGGALTGGLLITGGVLLCYHTLSTIKLGIILGLLITSALSGQFIPKVMGSRAAPHVVLMAILSGLGLVLTLITISVGK